MLGTTVLTQMKVQDISVKLNGKHQLMLVSGKRSYHQVITQN